MTAKQQKCSTTVLSSPECFCKEKLQGSTLAPLGVLPYVPCVHTCSSLAKGKRDVVTPRVKGMGEEYLRQDAAMTIIHSDPGNIWQN